MSPKQKDHPRQKRIDELLLTIGGVEESIRMSQEVGDWDFVKELNKLKGRYYTTLRRVVYGLPEESKLRTEEES